jgi:hypothetical protein
MFFAPFALVLRGIVHDRCIKEISRKFANFAKSKEPQLQTL